MSLNSVDKVTVRGETTESYVKMVAKWVNIFAILPNYIVLNNITSIDAPTYNSLFEEPPSHDLNGTEMLFNDLHP